MISSKVANGKAAVTFTLPPDVGAARAVVCGEWNGWASDVHEMTRGDDGTFSATLDLVPGRTYRFRYLVDGHRWENDWSPDAYVPNDFGGDDCLIDLTAIEAGDAARSTGPEPVPAGRTKAGAVKKAPAAKKAPPRTPPTAT